MTRPRHATIQALMCRFAEGERSAFEPLFTALWPIVRGFAGQTLPEADADDAAQEAIVKVFDRIVDFDPARDGVTWALAIASYEVMTLRRRRQRGREDRLLDDDAPTEETSPEDVASWNEQRRIVFDLLDASSDADRAAIEAELRGEIARGEAARKRRLRAFGRLRELWRRSHA